MPEQKGCCMKLYFSTIRVALPNTEVLTYWESGHPDEYDVQELFARSARYKISKRNSTQLITATFKMAYEERQPPSGLIFHSDRGAQYTSHRFQQLLHEHNTEQSFSQPGKPHDNAVAESFFASLKKEELYRREHPSDRAFQASVASYIEFYNTKRPHRTLKNLTPCQMEENFSKNDK